MIHRISIDELMMLRTSPAPTECPDPLPFADVRTPAEFAHGHMPGAFNLPLFTDAQRVQVGTTYNKVGKEAAILLGFDLAGPRWSGLIRQALEISPKKKIAVHCWRGGMRSGAVAWALELYGFEIWLVEGGYKRYRRWVLRQFEKTRPFRVLSGMTGSGKTRILHELRALGESVIDLEALARHHGSSYGSLGRLVQPSQEQFENELAEALQRIDGDRGGGVHPIWIEDEGVAIGKCSVPRPIWNQLQWADLFYLEVPDDARVDELVKEYGTLDKEFLIESTGRISKRLGTEATKKAVAAIRENRMDDFIRLVLVYYDKVYKATLEKKPPRPGFRIEASSANASVNAQRLLDFAKQSFR